MLFFFHGENFKDKNKKLKEVLAALRDKKKEALYSHFDYLDISKNKLVELLQTVGLIEQKNIILLSNIFKNPEAREFFLENLELFEKSDNAFLLTEDTLDKRIVKKIDKYSFKTYEFLKNKENFNIFLLSDYLQKKDKKNLWLFFHSTLQKGISPEEFLGILIWSLRVLALTERYSESDSGLNPFVYKKAKKNLAKWKNGEIESKNLEAVLLFHETRFSNKNIKNSLEKFILKL